MKNIYFPDEGISFNDLFFVCFMIERVSRKLNQRNQYTVNSIGQSEFRRLLSIANVQHCENFDKVADEWTEDYNLENGDFDITLVNTDYCKKVPSETDMGKVYARLIKSVAEKSNIDYDEAIISVYNSSICEKIDNYNCSAFYEPSNCILDAYYNDGF